MNASEKTKDKKVTEQIEMAWSARMSKFYEDLASGKATYNDMYKYFTLSEIRSLLNNGKLEKIQYDAEKNEYILIYTDESETETYFVQVEPSNNKVEIIKKVNTDEYKLGMHNEIIDITDDEEVNKDIYVFYYESTKTLVFNNINEGLEETATETWMNKGEYAILEESDESGEMQNIPWLDYNIKKVIFLNKIYPKSTYEWFKDLAVESFENIEYLRTKDVINMRGMFCGCKRLTKLDLSSFNTSNVTDMGGMFYDCKRLTNLDLSSFNTPNVTDMGIMFYNCNNLTNLDLSSFNTSNVTAMHAMFYGCKKITNLDLSNFNTEKLTDMEGMFYDCKRLTNLDLSSFNTPNITDMGIMFYNCNLTNLDLSNFNTEKVTNMESMFCNCNNLTNLDLSSFNTSNVTTMCAMFNYCENIINLDLSNFNTEKVTNMELMFDNCKQLDNINISNFDTSNVTNMYGMFNYCENIINLDLSNFNTENVTDMYAMFSSCIKLENLDLSSFNIENVEDMSYMFDFCESLISGCLDDFANKVIEEKLSLPIQFMNHCSGISRVIIPENFEEFGSYCFSNCKNLDEIYYNAIDATTENIVNENGAVAPPFSSSGKHIYIGNNVKNLPDYVFRSMIYIENQIILPEGLESIGKGVFANWKFETITIPSSVTNIYEGEDNKVFDNCKKLKTILVKKPENSILGAPWSDMTGITVLWNQ